MLCIPVCVSDLQMNTYGVCLSETHGDLLSKVHKITEFIYHYPVKNI